MSMSKFTPGPWSVGKLRGRWPDEQIAVRTPCGAEFVSVTVRNNNDVARQTADANARLIAAAPDLLESLDDCTAIIDTLLAWYGEKMPNGDAINRQRQLDAARVVIDKARGEESGVANDGDE